MPKNYGNESWLQSKDTSNISVNIKKHIKHGRHITKYKFADDPSDVIDADNQVYNGIDNIKYLVAYLEEMNLGEVEFSVFQCKSNSKIPAYYANIKLGNISLASSFPEKYSLPEVAKQVAARNALAVLKKTNTNKDIPITQDMAVVAERLEKELQEKKNFAGLFCDKVEDVYKEVYNECLPSDWLANLKQMTSNILIENLPNQNKSILYYDPFADKKKQEDLKKVPIVETSNLPLMKFVDKTERSVIVTTVDSNHMFWLLFVHDIINDDYDTLFKLINMPDESKNFNKMYNIEISDIYAIQIKNEWYRFQVIKIEDDSVTGIFIDLGMEWCVSKSNVMFLPQKFLQFPSQAIKCALSSLFFAPYFQVANDLFKKELFGKEFTVIPDNIGGDISLVTLYNGKFNMNTMIIDTIIEKTNFNKIDKVCKRANLSYVGGGYIYLHPPNETLLIIESILDSIIASRPLDQMYSKNSISPHKIYLVKCKNLDMWSRAKVEDFLINEHKFKVYFIDYGNYGVIDEDKFIDLQAIDPLLATIGPQALKVSFHLFPPDKLTESRSRALYEMINEKSLYVEVVSTNSGGIQIVDIYDADGLKANDLSFNAQLYQSI